MSKVLEFARAASKPLDPKITAKKSLKDLLHTAAATGVAAGVAVVAAPDASAQIADAVATLIPAPWNAIAAIALPGVIAGANRWITDWSTRHRTGVVVLGKAALEAAKARKKAA